MVLPSEALASFGEICPCTMELRLRRETQSWLGAYIYLGKYDHVLRKPHFEMGDGVLSEGPDL